MNKTIPSFVFCRSLILFVSPVKTWKECRHMRTFLSRPDPGKVGILLLYTVTFSPLFVSSLYILGDPRNEVNRAKIGGRANVLKGGRISAANICPIYFVLTQCLRITLRWTRVPSRGWEIVLNILCEIFFVVICVINKSTDNGKCGQFVK